MEKEVSSRHLEFLLPAQPQVSCDLGKPHLILSLSFPAQHCPVGLSWLCASPHIRGTLEGWECKRLGPGPDLLHLCPRVGPLDDGAAAQGHSQRPL